METIKKAELKELNGGCLTHNQTSNPLSYFFETVKNAVCIAYIHNKVILEEATK